MIYRSMWNSYRKHNHYKYYVNKPSAAPAYNKEITDEIKNITKIDKKLFNNLVELFDNINLESLPPIESKKKSIFICGMPRSGTKLVEQIVASQNQVRGAGEIHYLSKIINDNFMENYKFNKPKIFNEMSKAKNLLLEKYNDI